MMIMMMAMIHQVEALLHEKGYKLASTPQATKVEGSTTIPHCLTFSCICQSDTILEDQSQVLSDLLLIFPLLRTYLLSLIVMMTNLVHLHQPIRQRYHTIG